MPILTHVAKTDLAAAAVCALIGGFFAVQSWWIPIDPHATVSSRVVPLFISFSVMALGLLLGCGAILRNARGTEPSPLLPGHGFHDANFRQVMVIVGCGAVYVATFWAVNFLVANALALLVTLFAFGNRKWSVVFALSLSGAVIYQIIFMRFMILDDSVGALIDASALSNIFSAY